MPGKQAPEWQTSSNLNLRYGPRRSRSHGIERGGQPQPALSSFPTADKSPFSRGAGLSSTPYFGVRSPRASLQRHLLLGRPRSSCPRSVVRTAIRSDATRVARCARESAQTGAASSSFQLEDRAEPEGVEPEPVHQEPRQRGQKDEAGDQ